MIADQYASKTIALKDGRTVWGLAAPQPDGSIVVLQSNAQRMTIAKDEIDEIRASKKSAMPEGLLNSLTLEEIADLFAYLGPIPRRKNQHSAHASGTMRATFACHREFEAFAFLSSSTLRIEAYR